MRNEFGEIELDCLAAACGGRLINAGGKTVNKVTAGEGAQWGVEKAGRIGQNEELDSGNTGLGGKPLLARGALKIDSRRICRGDIFVAIRGKNLNGEQFIGDAFSNGAVAVICGRGASERLGVTGVCIEVDDVETALVRAAKKARDCMGAMVIGITGSVGKTTVKELCINVLSQGFPTDGTPENNNNILGLSLAVLNAFGYDKMSEIRGKYPHMSGKEKKYLVLEMGISHPGEMELLTDIARPDIAVVTNVGSMHAEGLGGRDKIAEEKIKIAADDCTHLFFNGDCEIYAAAERLGQKCRCIPIYCSEGEGKSELRSNGSGFGKIDNIAFPESVDSTRFDLTYTNDLGKTTVLRQIAVPLVGVHGATDGAYAVAVGIHCGLSETEIRRGLSEYAPVGLRQRLIFDNGKYRIIDCYNSGPTSVRAALSAMEIYSVRYGCKRRVAVLGSMLELGDSSYVEHYRLGLELAERGVRLLFTVGREAMWIAEGAVQGGLGSEAVFTFETPLHLDDIRTLIESKLKEDDIILYKASRGIGLERLIDKDLL
ncbi:MAG: hypothetical protein IKB34_04085 [Clostridia bacterium]|nr:hypothetical protein [Clostridia bacterium]